MHRVKAELQKLIALQNLDTTIRKLEKDQEAIPERRAEIEGEVGRLNGEFSDIGKRGRRTKGPSRES